MKQLIILLVVILTFYNFTSIYSQEDPVGCPVGKLFGAAHNEPPLIGAASVADPYTGLRINWPSVQTYPSPPQPGIRTLVFAVLGSDVAKVGNPEDNPCNNRVCERINGVTPAGCNYPQLLDGTSEVKLYYRYRFYWLDKGKYGGYQPSEDWSKAPFVYMFRMFDKDGNLKDINPAKPGVQKAPCEPLRDGVCTIGPYAGMKKEQFEAIKPFIWVGILRDFPPHTRVEYIITVRDNNHLQRHNPLNIDGALRVLQNITTMMKTRPQSGNPADLDRVGGGVYKDYGKWNLVVEDPAELREDPWPEHPYVYQPYMYYSGKCMGSIHHPVLVEVKKKYCEGAGGMPPSPRLQVANTPSPCCPAREDGGGGGGGGGQQPGGPPQEKPCLKWVYRCNECKVGDPGCILWGDIIKKGELSPPSAGFAGYSTIPCVEEAEERCERRASQDGWQPSSRLPDTYIRVCKLPATLKTAYRGCHSRPRSCAPHVSRALENPLGLDIRKIEVAINTQDKFFIKFTAENFPDQDIDSGWGMWSDLISVAWDILNGKSLFVNIWVVRINNIPESAGDFGDDGFLFYIPLLYNLLYGTSIGLIAQLIPDVVCELCKYAITNSKAHLMGNIADMMSSDPAVMSPVYVGDGRYFDPKNPRAHNFIYFSLDMKADNWQKFIQKNPHNKFKIEAETMTIFINNGKGNWGLPDLKDATSMLSLPITVDKTSVGMLYLYDPLFFTVFPDITAPEHPKNVKVANVGEDVNGDRKPDITVEGDHYLVKPVPCEFRPGASDECVIVQADPTTGKLKYNPDNTIYVVPNIKITWDPPTKNEDGTPFSYEVGYKVDFNPAQSIGGYNVYRRHAHRQKVKLPDGSWKWSNWSDWSPWKLLNADRNGSWQWQFTFEDPANPICWRRVEGDPFYFAVYNKLSTNLNQDGAIRNRHRKRLERADLINAAENTCYLWWVGRVGGELKDKRKVYHSKRTTISVNSFIDTATASMSTIHKRFDFAFAGNPTARYDDPPRYDEAGNILISLDPSQDLIWSTDNLRKKIDTTRQYKYQYKVTAADWPNPFCAFKEGEYIPSWAGDTRSPRSDSDGGNEYYKEWDDKDPLHPENWDIDLIYTGKPYDKVQLYAGDVIHISPDGGATWKDRERVTQNREEVGYKIVVIEEKKHKAGILLQTPPYNESSKGKEVVTAEIIIGFPEEAFAHPISGVVRDINGDGEINEKDIEALKAVFGTTPRAKNWDSNADLNKDGKINLVDFTILISEINRERRKNK